MSYLEKVDSAEKKLAIERSIADIDFRFLSTSFRFATGRLQFHDAVNEKLNEIAKEHKLNFRFSSLYEALKVTAKGREIIDVWKKERMA